MKPSSVYLSLALYIHLQRTLSILGITKQDHVSNDEALKRANLPSIEFISLQVQLHWADYARGWKIYSCLKQSSSASSKKESAIAMLLKKDQF